MGTLILAGSGEFLPIMRAIDEASLHTLPGLSRKVAILPTASGLEGDVPFGWIERGVRHFAALGCDAYGVPILGRADAGRAEHAAALAGADLVYLSGGNPRHLVESLRDTPAWEALLAVWARGGVLAGCSAGAMALCEQTVVRRGPGGVEVPPSWRPALGLLPGLAVLPHYDRFGARALPAVEVAPAGLTILGIDENTVVYRAGGAAAVRGARNVTVWRAGQPTIFRTGEAIPPEIVAFPD